MGFLKFLFPVCFFWYFLLFGSVDIQHFTIRKQILKKLIITETGDYGKSGQYGYYTLVAKVGIVKDGDYVIVVKRNDHVREEFSLKYDSSRANKDN